MKKNKSKNRQLTYPEKAGAMQRDARVVCCERAGKHWEKAVAAKSLIDEAKLTVFNELRETGIQLNEASGREQLTFNLNGKDFVRKEILPHLPEGMSVASVQCCCHIANTVKEPVKTVEELKIVEDAMTPFFKEQFGETKAPRELHSVEARNLFSTFVSRGAEWTVTTKELIKQEPMTGWPRAKVEEFVETLQPMAELYQEGKRLLLGM